MAVEGHTEDEQEHVVTITEARWVQTKYRPEIDGDECHPGYIPHSEESQDRCSGVETVTRQCTCGAELRTWGEVKAHFEEVGARATNAVHVGGDE